ncbi:MAG: hypothetical protein P1U58_21015 [Verrucomicrobiales bacterium]|nr:hypothetical protein [Verrucomicrobiales bacterium]
MALEEIILPANGTAPPQEISAFIKEANRRADEFYDAGLGLRYPKYIQSDPSLFHSAIVFLQEEGLLQGNVFCEWGCGFGIAAGIAALAGMRTYGIEIEEELVTRATKLMEDLDLPVEILNISYLPDGFEESEGHGGKDLISPDITTPRGGSVGTPQYDGLDPEEVDLFYVYPWPDQEEMMMDLFEAVATPGAILLMYLGDGEMAAFTHEESDLD